MYDRKEEKRILKEITRLEKSREKVYNQLKIDNKIELLNRELKTLRGVPWYL